MPYKNFPNSRSRHSRMVPLLVLLSACGGGSGGQADGGGGSASLSAAPAALSFSGVAGDTQEPAHQQVNIQVRGTVYVDVNYLGIAYERGTFQLNGGTATATVGVPAPVHVGAGVHTGTVRIRGYEGSLGLAGEEVRGSPAEIPVTYSVAGLKASNSSWSTPSRLSLLQSSGGPLPGPVTITLADGLNPTDSYGWSATVEHRPVIGLPALTWLDVSPLSGSGLPATLALNVVQQGQPGIEYSAYINITTDRGSALQIHVVYRAG